MWQEYYVREKLRELSEMDLAAAAGRPRLETARNGRPPVFGPVARVAGRMLRRAGEGLEMWASPRPGEPECRCMEAEAR
jgi:hypothetical protein